jgi:hypothetical protein
MRMQPRWATVAILACTTVPGTSVALADPVHLPNIVGLNMCFGLEPPANRPLWSAPALTSTRKLNSEAVMHNVVYDSENRITITEDHVNVAACNNLAKNSAVWNKEGKAEFCLSSWDKGTYIKVTFGIIASSKADKNDLMRSLYAVGACKLGDHPGFPSYGDTLKMGSGTPVLLPH